MKKIPTKISNLLDTKLQGKEDLSVLTLVDR